MLLLSSVQYNQTFSTTPAGNSRQFYSRPRYSREHGTRSRNYRGFHIFFNPVPAGIRGFGPIPTTVQNSTPNPVGGAYSARPDPLAGFKGSTSKGREGNGREGGGGGSDRKREGEEEEGKGREGEQGKGGGKGRGGEMGGRGRREGRGGEEPPTAFWTNRTLNDIYIIVLCQ